MAGIADQSPCNGKTKLSDEYQIHVADLIFEFLEENEFSSGSSFVSGDNYNIRDFEDETCGDPTKNQLFWESQELLLTENMIRTSTIESKIRQATKQVVKEMKAAAVCCCGCASVAIDSCRRCFQREVTDQLQHAGYNCGVCKAKWMNQNEIPAGEHTYIEVLDNSNSKKGVVRVIIELNFRTEFEMAKSSQEYNHLISRLPEIYVGKAERLEPLIKLLCLSSKRCMKDQNMHIAPWRKIKYMQAKWQGIRESETCLTPDMLSAVKCSNHSSRPMISLLTFDLVKDLKMLSGLQFVAIKVM